MKVWIPILLAVETLICACQTEELITYETGIADCKARLEVLRNESENVLAFISPSCMEGAIIPRFCALTLDRKTIDSSYFADKVTIINFWFMTCPPCIAEIPGFNALVDRFGSNKINYLAIGRDTEADIKDFLEQYPWQFDHIADGGTLIRETFQSMWGYPLTFVVDKKGKILTAFSGGMTDSTAVQEIQDKVIPYIEQAISE